MLRVIEVLGWLGAGLLLVAYARVSLGRIDPARLEAQALNALGSALLLLHAARHDAWPSATLNLLWLAVAIAACGRALLGARR